MKGFAKFLLLTLLLLLLAGGLAALVVWRRWPWWVGAALFSGILGLWLGVRALRIYVRRRRERDFIQRVLDQDQSALQRIPLQDRPQIQDLETRWSEAIGLLRTSHLRRFGNPLYVLPWFMVIGETGAGKTSAVHGAGLHSELSEVRRAGSLASTRNCDWWFFDQAIVLDTAGRYTIPLEEGPDREEWGRFLSLLARYRRREPLNGIVVVVSSDQLRTGEAAKLQEDAQEIRRRLDHLMRSLGSKVPVYVLVTKMDRLLGFSTFVEALGPQISEAMGSTFDRPAEPWRRLLDQALKAVTGRIRQLRTVLVHQRPDLAPEAFLLPAELEDLRPGLERFLAPVFEGSPYLETPPFRGLFFSSARPGEAPVSERLAGWGLPPPQPRPHRDEGGCFLKEFFQTILPRDRHLHTPVREYLRWKSLTRNTALVAWMLLWGGLIGALGLTFAHNARVIRSFNHEAYVPRSLSGDMATDLLTLDKLRLEILEMHRINGARWIPRFGLDQGLELEERVREHYLRLFRDGMLAPLNETLKRRVMDVDQNTSEEEMADNAGYLVTRIALIQARVEGQYVDPADPPPQLEDYRRATTDLLVSLEPKLTPDTAQLFADTYWANLCWFGDRLERELKIVELQSLLESLLIQKGTDLQWLAERWIPGTDTVELRDFWGEGFDQPQEVPVVSGAYTAAGMQRIEAFLELLGKTLPARSDLVRRATPVFWTWYQERWYETWMNFITLFPDGARGGGPARQERLNAAMSTAQNPYFKLLDRFATEFATLGDETPPPWAVLAAELNASRALGEQLAAGSEQSALDRIKAKEQKLVQKVGGAVDPQQAASFQRSGEAAKLWKDYLEALKALAPVTLSRESGFRMVTDGAGAGPAQAESRDSPFLKAYAAVSQMGGIYELEYDGEARNVWDLLRGPADHLLDHGLANVSAVLQEAWDEQVLTPALGLDGDRLSAHLFARPGGSVWKFTEGPGRAFLRRNPGGWVAKPVLGREVPFSETFLGFLHGGAEGSAQVAPGSYVVTLETRPLDVNQGALVEPTGGTLCLPCAEGKPTCLENFNYAKGASFKWNPDSCGDTTLSLQFPSFSLYKSWDGKLGFARFLADFESGSRTFTVQDFPGSEAQLKAAGVTWIKVSYRILGGDSVLRYLRKRPLRLPETILQAGEEE